MEYARRRRRRPRGLAAHDYLADPGLATAIFLALRMRRPLLLEGEAGVGKTEVAKVLARMARRPADPAAVLRGDRRRPGGLRVGLLPAAAAPPGPSRAGRRRRSTRTSCTTSDSSSAARCSPRSHPRVMCRRCCSSTRSTGPTTSSRRSCSRCSRSTAITVPELGTIRAAVPPIVVLTSNRTRDVHDALKRRCLYHWMEHPDLRARARDRAPAARPRCPRRWRATGRGRGRRAAQPRPLQAARRRRDDRLGHGTGGARCRAHRRGVRGRHARHGAEVPRRPGACAGARYRPARAATRCSRP